MCRAAAVLASATTFVPRRALARGLRRSSSPMALRLPRDGKSVHQGIGVVGHNGFAILEPALSQRTVAALKHSDATRRRSMSPSTSTA